ncbi:uncharacterized protein BO97DRAFT_190075 [Aspergillus homomorphus CBS 101889]|uniref:Uncharacterized protein n=1 Tax=Aspergillus homomorphus (strain CBS 101889) TaxID=1450537 RepID=A0A395HNN6_ASPHC|nr:hypothetical protein BO97DRAFT_190075 [Aspergillus homomorphus CBS 101889]RAL09099.1 hypothetical protein BO97DRAFT_190075 [Aspergillus homomorphus CBS 101889]
MNGDDRKAIAEWIGRVSSELPSTPPTDPEDDDRAESIPQRNPHQLAQQKRKLSNASMARANFRKRPHCEITICDNAGTQSYQDGISLSPSTTQSESTRQTHNLARIRAQLAFAAPKVIFLPRAADIESHDARRLWDLLRSAGPLD